MTNTRQARQISEVLNEYFGEDPIQTLKDKMSPKIDYQEFDKKLANTAIKAVGDLLDKYKIEW